jgi:hypothetical protein
MAVIPTPSTTGNAWIITMFIIIRMMAETPGTTLTASMPDVGTTTTEPSNRFCLSVRNDK